MIMLELIIVLAAIFLGARLGSIGIGFAGAMGVLALAILGLDPGSLPIDVILIIMAVIGAVAAMEMAGGLDYMVRAAERVLRSHPQKITYLAPAVTYLMTMMAGTGHTAYSTLPVIAEVAHEANVRPSRPLGIAVVASQIAITASPVSAAVVVFSGMLEPLGVSYVDLLLVSIPTTFAACMLTAVVSNRLGKSLEQDEVYQQRLSEGLIKPASHERQTLQPTAGLSVALFLGAIVLVVIYAIAISLNVNWITDPVMSRDEAIVAIMLTCAALIVLCCRLESTQILTAHTFRSGMSACICVLGVAWLGNTFVDAHIGEIKLLANHVLDDFPLLLAVALFFASTLLYSQAATTRALMPAALVLVDPTIAVASFAAVSALFVLPTYPTLLAAIEMDETGSTRLGKYVFDHPFLIPGVLAISIAVLLSFLLAPLIITG